MTSAPIVRPSVVPLPANRSDLENRRGPQVRHINDEVDSLFNALYENPEFQKFIDPVWPEDSVEGDLFIDDVRAAEMIQEEAKLRNIGIVSRAKLKTVVRALNVTKRRYSLSREQRKG